MGKPFPREYISHGKYISHAKEGSFTCDCLSHEKIIITPQGEKKTFPMG